MNLNKTIIKWKHLFIFFVLFGIAVHAQVGINTQTPEATLEVVGKPNDTNHYDGIIPPRITGEQLATKLIQLRKREQ